MTLAEYFAFLPYGKYAFYIWSSYLLALITLSVLVWRTRVIRKQVHQALLVKYSREKSL